MAQASTVVWFRQDLRLADNPALTAAVERARSGGGAVVPVFVWSPNEEGSWPAGGARRWWLHHSLKALGESLQAHGSKLVLRQGDTRKELADVIEKSGADAVFWNRRYEPSAIERDRGIKDWLRSDRGLTAKSFNSALLFEPWTVETGGGGPYKVYTPFWKNVSQRPEPAAPCPAPEKISAPEHWPQTVALDRLGLEPKRDWKDGLAEAWTPGEDAAMQNLRDFLDEAGRTYQKDRDFPADHGTSRLSPYLHHGEIGPRQVWHAVRGFMQDGRRNVSKADRDNLWVYLKEICWREFAYHVLYHFPHTPESPLQEKYKDFPWLSDDAKLKAWQKGRTGYPIIDAGMRQLWATGWMHNRVRMIAASFLVKDLLISWTEGAKWFWDTLVDADLANNTLGWQWAGGCGADAAPYFRVFNPVLQGEKFDKDGRYVRRWVPELKNLPDKWLHKPWEAGDDVLDQAGVELGHHYPERVVDHAEARDRALEALDTVKG